jgi:hypothetical protein
VVIGRRVDGSLIAHLVASVDPLTTTTFLGVVDAPPLELFGRAVVLRRGGRDIAVGPATRWGILGLHRLLSSAYQVAPLRRVWSFVPRWRSRAPGPLTTRRLAEADLPALLALVADMDPPLQSLRERQLWTELPRAAGSFDESGRLRQVAIVDEQAEPRLWPSDLTDAQRRALLDALAAGE